MTATALDDVKEILGEAFARCESPSLRLEKFVRIGDKFQTDARGRQERYSPRTDEINSVAQCVNAFRGRMQTRLVPSSAVSFSATLRGNLIVNQVGGILENAGLCLHPHFGFPTIPGSAVKGIARHEAVLELGRCPVENAEQFEKDVKDVFGTTASSGKVSFWSAWPERNATVATDIVTPHGGNDWTDPVPNAFPVVKKGTSFVFVVVSKDPRLRDLAVVWLRRALSAHGIGGKTAAGYGAFDLPDESPSLLRANYTLRLQSPAFLRGSTDADSGALREASLRGMLRWWWRVLYRTCFVETQLQELETYIWGGAGDSPKASKIAVRIVRRPNESSVPFDRIRYIDPLPRNFEQARTRGLTYLSYGMDERNHGRARRRNVTILSDNTSWELELSVRNLQGADGNQVLEHARLALLAWSTYGGIGSRSRKGFGSFDCGMTMPEIEVLFDRLTKSVNGFPFQLSIDDEGNRPYALTSMESQGVEVRLQNPWHVLDRIGYAMQAVASEYKHQPDKAVLGLPRKIHGPQDHPMAHQNGRWNPPQSLQPDNGARRFASPLFCHLRRTDQGYYVNVTFFPSPYVRETGVSEQLLNQVCEGILAELGRH